MNYKTQLLAIFAVASAAIGIGAYGIANSRSSSEPSTTVARQPGVMNHDGMKHGGMNHNMDVGPADANYDLRFIDSMIPHHQGALVMAQEALAKSKLN